jgi:uncharacterized membrane protein YbhN (UPF0104 family)
VHPWWLVAALALNGLSMVLRAVSWQAVLRAALPDVRLGSLVVVRATMIGVLVSALPSQAVSVSPPGLTWSPVAAATRRDGFRSFSARCSPRH